MRRVLVLPLAAGLAFGSFAFNLGKAEAMIVNPGLERFADALSPIEKAGCWRYGWHGWGWYPRCGWRGYYGWRPAYYGYYGWKRPYYGRWGWHRGWHRSWGWHRGWHRGWHHGWHRGGWHRR